ncbi:hydrogenase, partial [Vibrio breoganii]
MVKVLPTLVAVHVFAVLFYKLRSKPLTWAMVTGFQTRIQFSGSVAFASQWRALFVLALAAMFTVILVALA